jgi:hypothetical protein
MCTSPINPDSDHDALQDGWEVLGLRFPNDEFIDIPAIGANPRNKDIFVQCNYEQGTGAGPEVWRYITNLFKRRGITLHVSQNERSAAASPIKAEQAASLKDASGIYYFPPKLNWIHHYIYSSTISGRSSADIYITIEAGQGGRHHIYPITHELGHELSLGHGGRVGSNSLIRVGDYLYYDGGWDITNLKPNYLSVMNYGYNNSVLCFNPTTGEQIGEVDFSDQQLSSLNEALLAESDSAFATAVRGRTCTTATRGFVVANRRTMTPFSISQAYQIWSCATAKIMTVIEALTRAAWTLTPIAWRTHSTIALRPQTQIRVILATTILAMPASSRRSPTWRSSDKH